MSLSLGFLTCLCWLEHHKGEMWIYLLLSLLYYYSASLMLLVAIWVTFGNVQALYFDLHCCVNGLNTFLGLCDQS